MKKFICIVIAVVICFGVGYTAQLFQSDAIMSWYPTLNKPTLTPPNMVFPIAWSILYLLMGISVGLVVASDKLEKKKITWIFIVQLFLNFTWSICFFYFQNPELGLFNILLLDAAIIYYAVACYPTFKVSSLLFLPYIAWVGFATYLNLYIVLYN